MTRGRILRERLDLRRFATGMLVWAIPVLAIAAMYFSPRHIASPETGVTALLGLIVIMLAAQRPDLSLLGLIVFLPFQGLLLAKLWSWGLPASVAGHLGAWKEALALGVIVAGVRNLMATGRPLDTVDRLALGFVAVTILYAALQQVIVPGAPSASNIRLLGFRETGGFVLLLFGARHAPFGPGFARRAARAVLAVGGLVGAVGIFEAVDSSAWNHFVVNTVKYPAYQSAVLHTFVARPGDIRVYGIVGGVRIVRIGSVFLNQLTCGWYLILPFAVGLERAVRRTASPLVLLSTGMVGAALLLTQTRSAILGALLVAIVAFQPAAGRGRHWRTQVVLLLAALAMVAVPAAVGSGLTKRVASASNTSDQSTAGHVAGFSEGVDTIARHPLGLGLGTGAGTGQRFGVHGDVIAENNYLEVGDELGILPMVLFVALTLALLLALRRASRGDPDPLTAAVWAAGIGLAVAAWFLQTWSDFAVAWTFWGLAGAALSFARHPAAAVAVPRRAAAPALGAPAPRAPGRAGMKDWPPYRRARRGWYSLLEHQPAVYCAYRHRRQPASPVVTEHTDVVIEARPGCANSFAREAMLFANPGITVASHVHSPAQVLEAIRLRKPALVIIRDPLDAIASEAARFDDVDLRYELVAYARFYERLRRRADDLVVATFGRVTSRFDEVTEALNARFGCTFEPFPHHDAGAVERVFETLAAYDRSLGLGDGRSAIPGQGRSERNARARARLEEPRYRRLVRRCQDVYAKFAALERVRSEPVAAS